MKLITVFLILIVHLSYCQERSTFKVTYDYKLKKEKIIKNFKKKSKTSNPNLIKKSLELFIKSKPTEAFLYFNDTLSYYDVVERITIENNNYNKIDPSYAFAGRNLKFFNEATNDYLFEYQEESNFENIDEFLVKYPCNTYKIKRETKKINGFSCVLATTKDNSSCKVNIWFTPEINTSFGPQRFCGLPGLVIFIDAYAYTATLKKIESLKNKKIEQYPKNVKFIDTITLEKLSKESYNKIFKN
jgi:GLPGLI family protein